MSKLDELNMLLDRDPRDLKRLQITIPELSDQIQRLRTKIDILDPVKESLTQPIQRLSTKNDYSLPVIT